MDSNDILSLLNSNSLCIIFIIMFLEALNLTGIPALVIFPAIGLFIGKSTYSFSTIFFIGLSASILGSMTYYFVSFKFGQFIFDYFYKKFPRTQKSLDKALDLGKKHGSKFCLIGRLVPGVRTFVSLVSGIFRLDFFDYFLYSSLGIFIWNFVFIFGGYLISKIG